MMLKENGRNRKWQLGLDAQTSRLDGISKAPITVPSDRANHRGVKWIGRND
jgi:hypothetical protein